MSISDGNGEGSHVEIVEYTEHIPAQTVAQIFWLKNRRPAQWRDKQEVEHSGEITETKRYDLSKLSDEELKMLDDATKKI